MEPVTHGRKMTRRDLIRWSGVTAAAAMLAACTGNAPAPATQPPAQSEATEAPAAPEPTAAPPTEAAPAPLTLSWWQGWAGTTGMAAIQAVQDAFNEQAGPVKVAVQTIPEGPLEEKLQTAIAAGTPPEIGVCCVSYAQFYARGSFLPLDEYIAASQVVKKEDFVTGLFESMTWLGKTYGVPALECGPRFGMMYNKGLLEEAGLDEAAFPETWDELLEWHKALTKVDSAGNVERIGFDPRDGTAANGPWPNCAMFWAVSYGVNVWDESTMSFHFDDERLVVALERIRKFYDVVGAEQMASFRPSFEGWTQSPSASFPSGVEATLCIGYYSPGELVHSAPDKKVGATWTPASSERKGTHYQFVGGHPAYIPTGTKHPPEAFTFIEYLTSDEVADIMFSTTGWLPGRKAFYDPNREGVSQYPGLEWYLRSATEAEELWAGQVIPIDGFVNQERSKLYDAVIYGQKTPKEAAADMQAACTDELKKQFPELVG